MSTAVTPRTGRNQVEHPKRWSAPPRSKTIARAVRTPDEVIRDVRGLKLRQRVSLVLSDDVLREELEDMVSSRSKQPISPGSIRTYQDVLIPTDAILVGGFTGLPTSSSSVISDIRGADTMLYSKEERQIRCKLASVYRLMLLFGWGRGIYDRASCTVCLPGDDSEKKLIFVAPHGLLFNEVSASAIMKVDQDGNVVDAGKSNLGMSQSVFDLHATIHAARRDANCVMFLCPESVMVVAAMKSGLLPISREAVALGEISYHGFPGISLDDEAKNSLVKSFSSSSRVQIIANCGAICIGETLEETVFFAHLLSTACRQQVSALSAGIDGLLKVDDDGKQQMEANENQQKLAELHFEAWMRLLDSKGCKTGYNYRNPEIFKTEVKEAKGREVSPAKTSSTRPELAYRSAEGTHVRRTVSLGRGNTYRNRLKWLNSPVKATEYKRERELDNSEPVLVKDSRPENEDKDHQVFITTKVISVSSEPSLNSPPYADPNGGEPPEDNRGTEIHEELVTYVKAADRQSDPHGIEVFLDDSQDSLDASNQHAPVIVELVREPVGVVRRKSGSKVKKSRSFRDRLSKRMSSGH